MSSCLNHIKTRCALIWFRQQWYSQGSHWDKIVTVIANMLPKNRLWFGKNKSVYQHAYCNDFSWIWVYPKPTSFIASYLLALALTSYWATICLASALRTSSSSAVPTRRLSIMALVMQLWIEFCVPTGMIWVCWFSNICLLSFGRAVYKMHSLNMFCTRFSY